MKKFKTNGIIIVLCVLIAISSLGVGWTYAYFSAKAEASGSVTTGHIKITGISANSGNQLFYNINKIVPNQSIQTSVEVEVTTDIDYYTRVSFSLEVSNTGTHKAGCGDNVTQPIATVKVLSPNYASYVENGVSYCYKLTPTQFDTSGVTTEIFDLQLYMQSWVGNGGCSYFMGAEIKVNIFVEVVQANYLESQDKGGSYTQSNVATLHSLFSLAVGQNSGGSGNENVYTPPYEIIEMGMFPQSLKADNITVSSSPDANGYYIGSDGEKYVKHTMDLVKSWNGYDYREEFTSMKMNVSNDGRTMNDGSTYYFKLEPIKWRVLKEENGTKKLVCDNVLQSIAFQPYYNWDNGAYYAIDGNGDFLLDENGNKVYANNYEHSNLRSWLNGDFYNNAFTTAEKAKIQQVLVDNSARTTESDTNPYACDNTNDFVYALSYQDVLNTDYLFSDSPDGADKNKCFKSTDFARATGVYTSTYEYLMNAFSDMGVTDIPSAIYLLMMGYGLSEEEAYAFVNMAIGAGFGWLRSPLGDNSFHARYVGFGGIGYGHVRHANFGAVPALQIVG